MGVKTSGKERVPGPARRSQAEPAQLHLIEVQPTRHALSACVPQYEPDTSRHVQGFLTFRLGAKPECQEGDVAKEQERRLASLRLRPRASVVASRPIPHTPSLVPLTSKEALYVDVYRYNIAPKFPDRDFWRRMVQREAVSDACVRESVIALGALWLAQDQEKTLRRTQPALRLTSAGDENATVNANLQEAARHHVRAISTFRKRMLEEGSALAPRSIFIATYLFVIFEQSQGNNKEADRLLIYGMKLLHKYLAIFRDKDPMRYRGTSALAARSDDEGLLDAERRFTQMALVNPNGEPISDRTHIGPSTIKLARQIKDTRVPSPGSPTDFILAEHDLWVCRSGIWLFRLAPSTLFNDPAATMLDMEIQEAIETKHYEWMRLFELQIGSETCPVRRKRLEFESTHQLLGFICWACNSDKTEMAWDAYIPDCQEVMRRFEAAEAEANKAQSSHEHIPLEHALFYITQKCRHVNTRERAIQMMRRVVKPESSWHAKLLLAACEAHILHEEQGRDKSTGILAPSKRLSWTEYSWNDEGTQIVLSLTSALPTADGKCRTKLIYLQPSHFNAIPHADVSAGD